MTPPPADLAGLRAGGKAALARTLAALERAPDAAGIAALLDASFAAPRGMAVGLTGPPGVGKSTLINAFVARLRTRGESVGVIAVDPSSPLSGGALLGDRTRIGSNADDAGVYVRSMAARRRLGGVADLTYPASVLMRALFDWVIVETVGVGQSETEIADCADLVIFCVQPGAGDALQFMKAGVTELPDIVLVTKGDVGAAALRAAGEARGALSLAAEASAEVAIVSAQTGAGIDAVVALIVERSERLIAAGGIRQRRSAQARAWARSRINESFGSVGAAALDVRIAAHDAPFGALACLLEAAQAAVYQSLKDI